jgi:hypothetical protein
MQENPPAAAASAKLADIFKASRRSISGMMFSRGFEPKDLGKIYNSEIQGRLIVVSTKIALTSTRRMRAEQRAVGFRRELLEPGRMVARHIGAAGDKRLIRSPHLPAR